MRIATSPHDFKLMVAAASKPKDDGPEGAEIPVLRTATSRWAPSAPPAPAPARVRACPLSPAPPAPPMTVGVGEPARCRAPGAVGAASGRHLLTVDWLLRAT